jgi:XTP/dITP diphosphohydrolase
MGKHEGTLANKVLGNDTDKKWSDLWYIYKPQGYDKTLAEMTDEERKNRNRYDDVDSWTEFANWYKTKDK